MQRMRRPALYLSLSLSIYLSIYLSLYLSLSLSLSPSPSLPVQTEDRGIDLRSIMQLILGKNSNDGAPSCARAAHVCRDGAARSENVRQSVDSDASTRRDFLCSPPPATHLPLALRTAAAACESIRVCAGFARERLGP